MYRLLLCFLLFSSSLHAQTFNGSTGAILDQAESVFTMPVSGLQANLDTTGFGLETVCINLTHTYVADLEITLVSPSGQSVLLAASVGGDGDNFQNTCFSPNAPLFIGEASAPFTGTFRPAGQLGTFNNHQSGNGTWKLKVRDNYGGDVGNVLGWTITFGNDPIGYLTLSSSNLPIVIINTNGQDIQDDPKIPADMGIIYNGEGVRNYVTDPKNAYNGRIGIEFRGSSSQMFPKKSFGVELWDANNNSIDASLLGMPEENDWVLNVSYSDKSLLRNSFTYRTWEKMGHYAPRGQHVEVVLNGQYWGVYYLCEKIKRDAGRLDIAKLKPTDISGDDLTGGYILKIDKFTGTPSNNWESMYDPANIPGGPKPRILVEYPKIGDMVPQQLNYIQSYVDSFEVALQTIDFTDTVHGYRHFADESTFIDYLLISELNRNVDGYRISTFFYKDKNSHGGKLKMGPVWDYDIAYGNADYCDGWKTSGWGFDFNIVCGGDGMQVPFWWNKLMQDPLFTDHLRCRWENLKSVVFSPAMMDHWIDSVALRLDESQHRNFIQWPILGTHIWPNYYVASNYKGEVDTLKWWLRQRFEWLDAHIPGSLQGCGFAGIDELDPDLAFNVYPNPFSNQVELQFNAMINGTVRVELVSLTGQLIYGAGLTQQNGRATLSIPDCTPGIYLLNVIKSGKKEVRKLVKE